MVSVFLFRHPKCHFLALENRHFRQFWNSSSPNVYREFLNLHELISWLIKWLQVSLFLYFCVSVFLFLYFFISIFWWIDILVYQMVTGLLTSSNSARPPDGNVRGVELYYDLIMICLKFDHNFLHISSWFLSDFLMLIAILDDITTFRRDVESYHWTGKIGIACVLWLFSWQPCPVVAGALVSSRN